MRLYLDENLSPTIAALLRQAGVDTASAHEVGNIQWDDHAQLTYAIQERRAIITANVSDFVELAREAVMTNRGHAGIILVPPSFRGDGFQAIADAILAVVAQYPSGLVDLVIYLRRE